MYSGDHLHIHSCTKSWNYRRLRSYINQRGALSVKRDANQTHIDAPKPCPQLASVTLRHMKFCNWTSWQRYLQVIGPFLNLMMLVNHYRFGHGALSHLSGAVGCGLSILWIGLLMTK